MGRYAVKLAVTRANWEKSLPIVFALDEDIESVTRGRTHRHQQECE